MTSVVVTGVTGKSGRFFYEELRRNAATLSDFAFYFIVRNRQKAEMLLTAEGLNQTICEGSAADTEWVNSVFENIVGGGYYNPFTHCRNWSFRASGGGRAEA